MIHNYQHLAWSLILFFSNLNVRTCHIEVFCFFLTTLIFHPWFVLMGHQYFQYNFFNILSILGLCLINTITESLMLPNCNSFSMFPHAQCKSMTWEFEHLHEELIFFSFTRLMMMSWNSFFVVPNTTLKENSTNSQIFISQTLFTGSLLFDVKCELIWWRDIPFPFLTVPFSS